MKTANWVMMCLLAGGLALTGCSKQAPPTPAPMGVTIDLPRLQQAFANTTPELQAALSEVTMGMRYSDYPRAFTALDKLANAPGITDAQKKIVGEVTEQMKALASKDSAPK
jgi:hypothetical protein